MKTLLLLALASHAYALTMTHTIVATATSSTTNLNWSAGTWSSLPRFDAVNGTLNGVEILTHLDVAALATAGNPFSTVDPWSPRITASPYFTLGVVPQLMSLTGQQETAVGPITPIAPGGLATFTAAFSFDSVHLLSTAADLAWFTGTGTRPIGIGARGMSLTPWGTLQVETSAAVAFIYHYDGNGQASSAAAASVPERGSMLALCCGAILCVSLARLTAPRTPAARQQA